MNVYILHHFVFGGASWQRCRTHFMTNLLTRVPRRVQPWVATMVRTIYQQPSPDEVHAQLDRVTDQLQDRFPQVASLLDEAGPDILAFSSFPVPHWKKIWSNNPPHPPFSPSMKLLQRPNPQKRLRLRQHQQDDALLHHLTGRDRLVRKTSAGLWAFCPSILHTLHLFPSRIRTKMSRSPGYHSGGCHSHFVST